MSVALVFFFFKQKTAYEMRISDWSSDVCSSDLQRLGAGLLGGKALGVRLDPGHGPAIRPCLLHRGEDAVEEAVAKTRDRLLDEIGRASCRERVCQYV